MNGTVKGQMRAHFKWLGSIDIPDYWDGFIIHNAGATHLPILSSRMNIPCLIWTRNTFFYFMVFEEEIKLIQLAFEERSMPDECFFSENMPKRLFFVRLD